MDSSSQKIFFRNEYSEFQFFKKNNLPRPIFFGIPTLAFHVQIIEVETKENFIGKTILYFKNKGLSVEEISKKLCLNEQLVQIIIEDNKKNKCETEETSEDKITRTEDFYIFYNLLSHEFMNGVIEADDFNLHELQERNIDYSNVYFFKNNIGQSKDNADRIRLLGYQNKDIFDVSIMPTREQIIRCHKENSAFSYKEYLETTCFPEIYPVWVTVAYSVTREKNDFSIISPFNFQRIEFSNSLYLLVKKFLDKNPNDCYDIPKYEDRVKENIKRNEQQMFRINNRLDREVYQRLEKEFKDNDFSTPFFISQMTLMETSFWKIQKKYNRNDAGVFFDCANNVLEELLTNLYSPFGERVVMKLNEEKFFTKVEEQKTEGDMKRIIWYKFFEKTDFSDDLAIICTKCSPSEMLNSIKKKTIGKENKYKLGLFNLFVANMIVFHYFKNQTPFSMIFTSDIEMSKIQEMILNITEQRNKIRHEISDKNKLVLLDKIKEYFDNVNKLVRWCLNDKDNKESNAINEENIEQLTVDLLIDKEEIAFFPTELQNCYVKLLDDVKRKYPLYFSDCVVAFEKLSEVLINYCLRKIHSLEELKKIMEIIPDREDEAKLFLDEQLDYCSATCGSIFELKINVKTAKEAIIDDNDSKLSKSPSTLILFAPMLLAATDNVGFVDLFNRLGTDYFETIKKVVHNRGHDKQVCDWNSTEDITDLYKKYCLYITLLNREEL